MVEVVGHKLKTHHPVIEPVSDSESGTEFFDAETEGPDPPFCLAETHAETRTNSKKPAVRGTNARITRGVRYLKTGWWCAQSDTNRSPLDIRLRTGNFLQNSANNRLSAGLWRLRIGNSTDILDGCTASRNLGLSILF